MARGRGERGAGAPAARGAQRGPRARTRRVEDAQPGDVSTVRTARGQRAGVVQERRGLLGRQFRVRRMRMRSSSPGLGPCPHPLPPTRAPGPSAQAKLNRENTKHEKQNRDGSDPRRPCGRPPFWPRRRSQGPRRRRSRRRRRRRRPRRNKRRWGRQRSPQRPRRRRRRRRCRRWRRRRRRGRRRRRTCRACRPLQLRAHQRLQRLQPADLDLELVVPDVADGGHGPVRAEAGPHPADRARSCRGGPVSGGRRE
jgi:hypothetical protein